MKTFDRDIDQIIQISRFWDAWLSMSNKIKVHPTWKFLSSWNLTQGVEGSFSIGSSYTEFNFRIQTMMEGIRPVFEEQRIWKTRSIAFCRKMRKFRTIRIPEPKTIWMKLQQCTPIQVYSYCVFALGIQTRCWQATWDRKARWIKTGSLFKFLLVTWLWGTKKKNKIWTVGFGGKRQLQLHPRPKNHTCTYRKRWSGLLEWTKSNSTWRNLWNIRFFDVKIQNRVFIEPLLKSANNSILTLMEGIEPGATKLVDWISSLIVTDSSFGTFG